MSIKIMVLAGLAVAGGGAAWVATSDADPQPAAEATAIEVAAESPAPVQTAEVKESTPAASSDNKVRWEARRAAIQHARKATPPVKAEPSPHHGGMKWEAASDSHHEFCTHDDEGCAGGFAQQMTAMVEGCKDFMSHTDPAVSMTARLIGAPGVGTIVESVELSGDEVPEDLQECLTETMYTLDLGPAEQDFEREMTVMIGGAFDAAALADLDDETRAAVEAAMAAHTGMAEHAGLAEHEGEGDARLMFLSNAE